MASELVTLAMATYKDYEGVWMTVRHFRRWCSRTAPILVLDNNITSCVQTADCVRASRGHYIHRPDLTGTATSRSSLFAYARTPWVLVVDSHIILDPGCWEAATRYAKDHPVSRDIVSGPLVYDNDDTISTHWRVTHPPGVWGEWDRAWRHSSGKYPAFEALPTTDGQAHYRSMIPGQELSGPRPPLSSWSDHGRTLYAAGFVHADTILTPFEINATGLGYFMMRKDVWPGFHPLHRKFGGEEGYIQAVVRKNGGRAICDPRQAWSHRWRDHRPGNAAQPYPNSLQDQVWNHLVMHRELGLNAVAEIEAAHVTAKRPDGTTEWRVNQAHWRALVVSAASKQPLGERLPPPKRQKLLGVWYTNNAAPEVLMRHSLQTIRTAADTAIGHDVKVSTCTWRPINGNPFPTTLARRKAKPGHATIIEQIRQAMEWATAEKYEWDAVCFLEHDVLYPADYFDRVGDALAANPTASVVSNLDYAGLNGTGWLAVKERHEPMHQLTVRREVALANLDRAEADCEAQGWAYLEPGSQNGDNRTDWVRIPVRTSQNGLPEMPAIHVDHKHRFTSHHEAVYAADSGGRTNHPYWGEHKNWWHGAVVMPKPGCPTCGKGRDANGQTAVQQVPTPQHETAEQWYESARDTPSDCHEHMATVREYAARCKHVTEFNHWGSQWLAALITQNVETVVSCSTQAMGNWEYAIKFLGNKFRPSLGDVREMDVEETDLLLTDTEHCADQIYAELVRHAPHVRKWIIVHDTNVFGEQDDRGRPGLMPGIRRYLKGHPEWMVVRHDKNNNGLTVLSRLEEDRPPLPSKLRQGWNFAKAKVKHEMNGGTYLPLPLVQERMDVCLTCPKRVKSNCSVCGCFLSVVENTSRFLNGSPGKLWFPTEECPLGYWHDRPEDGVAMSSEEIKAAVEALGVVDEVIELTVVPPTGEGTT